MIELGIKEIREKIRKKEMSCVEITKAYIEEIGKSDINAVIEVFDDAILEAEKMDEKIKNGFDGKLAGVPLLIKDNILVKGKHSSAGSKMLKDYIAEYTSTVAGKLVDAGAIILGRANMDEFAMGSSTETSFYGKTLNPLDKTRVPGGSSGGSAAAVTAGLCPVALGTDTGGSVRQPSSYCGCVGMKPTYGRVSRYGIIAYASSFDQVGPITRNVEDNAIMLEVLSGEDKNDETSSKQIVDQYSNYLNKDIKGLKVGVVKQITDLVKGLDVEKKYFDVIDFLKKNGAEIVDVELKNIDLSLPIYYIIATAEATSNLARFDGVKYSFKSEDAKTLDEIYKKTRTEGFGDEVKRRIMMGNYVLSSGYFDAYYNKAKALQGKMKMDFEDVFKKCDVILTPTTTGEAFKIGEKSNPLDVYKEDIFTVTANMMGIPAISIPYGKGKNSLPFGIQFFAKYFDEGKLYQITDYIEKHKGE